MSSRIDRPIYQNSLLQFLLQNRPSFLQGISQPREPLQVQFLYFGLDILLGITHVQFCNPCKFLQLHVQTMKNHFALHITRYLFHFTLVNITIQGQLLWQWCISHCYYIQPLWQGHQKVYYKLPNRGPKNGQQANPSSPMLFFCLLLPHHFQKYFFVFFTNFGGNFTFWHASAPFFMLSIAFSALTIASDLKLSFLASQMSSYSLVFIGEFVVKGKSYPADH